MCRLPSLGATAGRLEVHAPGGGSPGVFPRCVLGGWGCALSWEVNRFDLSAAGLGRAQALGSGVRAPVALARRYGGAPLRPTAWSWPAYEPPSPGHGTSPGLVYSDATERDAVCVSVP